MREPTLSGVADEVVVGEVSFVVFANPSSGFGVVELLGADGELRAAGPLAGVSAGQPLRLVGRWVDHPRHGTTFEALYYELAPPERAEALEAFLASPRFTGVGDRIAERLVKAFGLELPEVIEREPESLAKVRGVSPALAQRIAAAWRDAGALAALVERLSVAGVPASIAQGAHRVFGDRAETVLEEDPYRLLEVPAARWAHAESLARAAGLDAYDDRRLTAGASAAHRALRARGGHVAVATEALTGDSAALLGVDAIDARRGLDLAVARGRLACEPGLEETLPADGTGARAWYTPADLAAERGLAADVARLAGARSRVAAAVGAEPDLDADLVEEQAAAVRTALAEPVSVLTGGPGTGKTRAILEVVRACEEADLRVACAAPTGRAAKRVEELTARPASTVHRLLDAQPRGDGGFAFTYGRQRRLPHDLLVVDEWSMADLHLAAALLAAVDDGAHLLLVGDADQLPSVGPGAVLRDLLAASAQGAGLGATRLSTIHRQAAESRIVTLAHAVNAGEVATPRGRDRDVFAVPERSRAVPERVAAIVAERAPTYFGCAPRDVQVLSPMYRGPAGVDALNAALKDALNPARGRPATAGLHEGDRVVQTRNDAELGVANGDVGEVIAADPAEGTLEVAFPQGVVPYEAAQAGDLRAAWCLTVHKSQGGEWPVVVLVLDRGHRAMLTRELVYTAITRARDGLLLVGDPALLPSAAARTGSGARERATRLAERLVAATA